MDGLLVEVLVETQGSETTAAVAVGALSVPVEDLTDFEDGAGQVRIDGVVYDWTGVDDSTMDAEGSGGLLLLATGLTAVVEDFTPVEVLAGDEPATDYYADVVDPEADEDAQPIRAHLVTREERLAWPVRVYDPPVGVSLFVDEQDRWRIDEVKGVVPDMSPDSLDRTRLSEIIAEDAPAGTGSGQTVSTEPPPASTDGYAEDHFWWQVVDGERLGTWSVTGGVFTPVEVVTRQAVEDLGVLNLSAVNAELLTMTGGSIYIAQGEAGSVDEGFSGTSLPSGWTLTKSGPFGDDPAGLDIPGASVVTSGPEGQSGSALLIDYGSVGVGSSGRGSGWVRSPLLAGVEQEAFTRFRCAVAESEDEACYLTVRGRGVPFRSLNQYDDQWSAVTLDLAPWSHFGGNTDFYVHFFNRGSREPLGTCKVPGRVTDEWFRARLKVSGRAVMAKVWADTSPEPATWKVWDNVGLDPAEGYAGITWQQYSTNSSPGNGQKVWIDQFAATGTVTGFQVNPDGTGSWPAIGLGAGDAAWRTVGASGQPAFQNGWAASSGMALRFRKSPTGDVTITGDLSMPANPNNTVIFTLPEGYRPTIPYPTMFVYQNATGTTPRLAAVSVNPDGTVVFADAGNVNANSNPRAVFTINFSTL